MNALTDNRPRNDYTPEMGRPLFASFIMHVLIFGLATFGFPYLVQKPELLMNAVSVEIVPISDISRTNKVGKPQEQPEKAPEPAKREPPPPQEKPAELEKPTPPEVEKIPEPPKEKPEPVKKELPKEEPKPKEKPKPVEKKVEEKKKPERTLDSILKDITPTKEPPLAKVDAPTQQNEQAEQAQIADFSTELTRSEQDALNQGVEPCWNIQAGGKNAEQLIVSLRVYVNPDMTVRDVQILEQMRYNMDTHYRAAADAARRALMNPRCSKLNLPLSKYQQWKVFKYNFDPSHML